MDAKDLEEAWQAGVRKHKLQTHRTSPVLVDRGGGVGAGLNA